MNIEHVLFGNEPAIITYSQGKSEHDLHRSSEEAIKGAVSGKLLQCKYCGSFLFIRNNNQFCHYSLPSVERKINDYYSHYGVHPPGIQDSDDMEMCLYRTGGSKQDKELYAGEKEKHKTAKRLLADCLRNKYPESKIDIEKWLRHDGKWRIPDVLLNNDGVKYAFEIQRSFLREETLVEKNNFYKAAGVKCIWINLLAAKENANNALAKKLAASYTWDAIEYPPLEVSGELSKAGDAIDLNIKQKATIAINGKLVKTDDYIKVPFNLEILEWRDCVAPLPLLINRPINETEFIKYLLDNFTYGIYNKAIKNGFAIGRLRKNMIDKIKTELKPTSHNKWLYLNAWLNTTKEIRVFSQP